MFLQVGFKSLSYEMQEQQPAYDSNSLFGKKQFFSKEKRKRILMMLCGRILNLHVNK